MDNCYWPHHHRGPWRDAPPWAIELREMLRVIILNQGAMMSQSDDLAAGVLALTTSVQTLTDNTAAHDVAVQNELAALTAALAGGATGTDPVVTQAIANIAALSTSVAKSAATIKTETDALVASLPAPTPAP